MAKKKAIKVEVQADNSLLITYEDQSQIRKLTDGTIRKICPMCDTESAVDVKICQGNLVGDDESGKKNTVLCGTYLDDYVDDSGWSGYGTEPK